MFSIFPGKINLFCTLWCENLAWQMRICSDNPANRILPLGKYLGQLWMNFAICFCTYVRKFPLFWITYNLGSWIFMIQDKYCDYDPHCPQRVRILLIHNITFVSRHLLQFSFTMCPIENVAWRIYLWKTMPKTHAN